MENRINEYINNWFKSEPDDSIDLPYYDNRIQESAIGMLEHIALNKDIDMKTRRECVKYTYIIASDSKYSSPNQLYKIPFIKKHLKLAWKDIKKEWSRNHSNWIWISYLGENAK